MAGKGRLHKPVRVLEWLDNQSPTIVVATDGSLRDSTTAWAWTSDAQRVFEWSSARDGRSSSFRAECEAYEDALVWLSQVTTAADRTYLLTDSLSLISKIQAGRIKENWVLLFRGIKGHFVSVYVPGHCGISFNSKADRLAGQAEPLGYLIRSPSDVITEIARQLDEEDVVRQQQHWSTND